MNIKDGQELISIIQSLSQTYIRLKESMQSDLCARIKNKLDDIWNEVQSLSSSFKIDIPYESAKACSESLMDKYHVNIQELSHDLMDIYGYKAYNTLCEAIYVINTKNS